MQRRRKLTTRPLASNGGGLVLNEGLTEQQVVKFLSNPRNGFCSNDPDKVIVSLDYSSQEVATGAVLSNDPAMVEAYLAPKKLIKDDGSEVVNPRADLHTLTAATCSHQHLVAGLPETEWYDAVCVKEPGETKKARDIAKGLNFAMLYLSTPQSISERNHIRIELAKQWVDGHMVTYKGYYDWANEYGAIAAARGFAIIPYTQRLRWVAEERSGGREGDSAVRSAVNAAIQSLSATQTKRAMLRVQHFFNANPQYDAQLIGQVHDELLIYCKGKSWVKWDECEMKDGVYTKLKFGHCDQALEVALKVQKIMEKVQTEIFTALGSNISGASSFDIAPSWAH